MAKINFNSEIKILGSNPYVLVNARQAAVQAAKREFFTIFPR